MFPNSEPTQQDVQAVNAALTNQPGQPTAPQPTAPQPTQEAPQQPQAPQEPSDPFANFQLQTEPAPQVQEPQAQPPAPGQTTEATAPIQPQAQPQQPQAQPQQQAEEQYQSFDDYVASIIGDPGEPTQVAAPQVADLDPQDPNAIQVYFDNLMKQAVDTATKQAEQTIMRRNAIQNAERTAWDSAFETYPSLRTNKELRDIVHNIRMAEFSKGVAMTPTQAAQRLLKLSGDRYRQGIADNQVQTTIQSTQPTGGGGVEVIPQSTTGNTLKEAASLGEAELAAALDAQIKAGKL